MFKVDFKNSRKYLVLKDEDYYFDSDKDRDAAKKIATKLQMTPQKKSTETSPRLTRSAQKEKELENSEGQNQGIKTFSSFNIFPILLCIY
jgi:hypothetical protein